ncbi:hypothetical protein P6F26_05295 [Roseibacterium sp. SDUM158017]|uniref:hypothetical protein n=1 Tax=Roseicyclus salinarum TaxID=3036773 RepID=UPI0024153254|nr:hypothetical protein [Roseibacterium sp. SDUM158017]MDG4647850.1 hypothetical protein [Roseibacterium sp. SDUM158017]
MTCSAPVRGLHHAGAAARDHDEAVAERPLGPPDDAPEFAGDLVVAAFLQNAAGDAQAVGQLRVAGVVRDLPREVVHAAARRGGFGHAGAAEDDDGICDAVLLQKLLGLGLVELEPQAAIVVAV